jgi:hypothetical protein
MQDLWLLDVKDLKWTATDTTGTGPSARHSMGFVGLDEDRILLFGGVSKHGNALDDLMLLNTQDKSWSTLKPGAGAKPSARYKMGIAFAAVDKRVYVVGGKLSAWTSGGSQYSWDGQMDKSGVKLESKYSEQKGNDDVWELQMTGTQTVAWTRRIDSLYASVCNAEYQKISAASTFCVGFKGLSGIGLASDQDGSLYILGGNDDAGEEDEELGSESVSESGSESSASSGSGSESAALFPYANFFKLELDSTGEELEHKPLTALSTEADILCSASDTDCKKYFAPSPAEDIAIAADASGLMVFLHPSTGDWWQCAPSQSNVRWVRNNGMVMGRSTILTAPTSFFASTYTNSKLILIGGGFEDQAFSWNSNMAPAPPASSEIGNSMELDFTTGVWNDLDSSSNVSAATLRYGHGMAQGPAGPGTLILFGGTRGNIDNSRTTSQASENRELINGRFAGVIEALNDLWLYRDKEWSEIVAVGRITPTTWPRARSFFGFSTLPDSDNFILFGGFSKKRLPELSDTWKLTVTLAGDKYTGRWELIEPTGPSPSGRAGLGLVLSNDGEVHMFGGGVFDWGKIDDGTEPLLFRAVIPSRDHHWVFNPVKKEWRNLLDRGIVPSARCFSGFVKGTRFRANSLFLFGGIDRDGNLLNDLWEYRTTSATWREISSFLTGQPPSPRLGLGLISDDSGDLYVVGGEGTNAGLRDFFKVPLPYDDITLPTSQYEFLQVYDEVCVFCVWLRMRMQEWPLQNRECL